MNIELIIHPMVLPVAFPLVAGFICFAMPARAERVRSVFVLICTAVTVVFVWPVFAEGDRTLDVGSWMSLRVDGLSAFVLLAIAVFSLLIAAYSQTFMRAHARQREYYAYLLWTLGMACGAVLANDFLSLLVFWGFLGLTLYLMIGIAGPKAADAARKSLMIVGGTDALLVFGVVLAWTLSGSTRMDTPALPIDDLTSHIAFLIFAAAALAKAGAVPFHAWVPDCGQKADVPVAAFLPASLDKLLGIYLLARLVLDLFQPTLALSTMLMVIGAITILGAVMAAMVQHDLKRLLSYHAVSQVGYMVLGIGTGTPLGLAGALFHMLNNTIYKSCLFLCAGNVEKAAGSTDLDRLGGLSRAMPVTFAASAVAALAISGIPPLNGFASKWMIYQGIIHSGEGAGPVWILWLVVAMVGSALTLASFVKVLHATFLCKAAPDIARRPIRDAHLWMVLPPALLAALCVVFGIFPFSVPLDLLIFPAVSAEIAGVWWAGLAAALILVAVVTGLIVYALTMTSGRLRRVDTYVGGEHLKDVYIRGVEPGLERHVEVTGVSFYDTIEQLPGLRWFYEVARRKMFDVYELGAKSTAYVIVVLRAAHTGALPAYLTWFLVGL